MNILLRRRQHDSIITDLEANVLHIHLERIGTKVFPGYAHYLSLETKDNEHIAQVLTGMREKGYSIEIIE
nr:hypothetical protein [Bacillus sp. 123MFChir2]